MISAKKSYRQLLQDTSALGPSSIVKEMVVCDTFQHSSTAHDNFENLYFYFNYLNLQREDQIAATGKESVGRHQPKGFVELAKRYGQYEVLFTKLEIWYQVASINSSDGAPTVDSRYNAQPVTVAFLPDATGIPMTQLVAKANTTVFNITENVGCKVVGDVIPVQGNALPGTGTDFEWNRHFYTAVGGGTYVPDQIAQTRMNKATIKLKPTEIKPSMTKGNRQCDDTSTENLPPTTGAAFTAVGVNMMFLSSGDGWGPTTPTANFSDYLNRLAIAGHYRMTYRVKWTKRRAVAPSNIIP